MKSLFHLTKPVLLITRLPWVMCVSHKVIAQQTPPPPPQKTLQTLALPYTVSVSLLVQPSRVAWAMISNFNHYVSSLHNWCLSIFFNLALREYERGIPPCSNKTQRACPVVGVKKQRCIFNRPNIGCFIINEGVIVGGGLPLHHQGNEMVRQVLGH